MKIDHTVVTDKPFEEAVASVTAKAAELGFRVLHVHDFAATLAEKGFLCEPLKVIEICNARYASQALAKDVKLSLMLPCPISVYFRDGKTHISTMLPSLLSHFYPHAGIEPVAQEVEKIVVRIVEESR
jgi:uncharacterized protein (DUF302 family)